MATRSLEVNGVSLTTPAWRTEALAPLLDAGAFRGSDRRIAFVDGEQPLRRRRDSWHVLIGLFVFGAVDMTGAPYSDPQIGLETNLDYLNAHVLTPNIATTAGMWTITLHRADGTSKTGQGVIVPPFAPQPWGFGTVKGVLDLIIPAGILV